MYRRDLLKSFILLPFTNPLKLLNLDFKDNINSIEKILIEKLLPYKNFKPKLASIMTPHPPFNNMLATFNFRHYVPGNIESLSQEEIEAEKMGWRFVRFPI